MFRRSVIAAVIGGLCGTIAGYYWPKAGEQSVAVPAAAATNAVPASAPQVDVPRQEPVSAQPLPRATPAIAMPPTALGAESRDVVQRARELAKQTDVTGLMALREEVARRAEREGEQDAPVTKQRLDEIDHCLAEARALRLKLDAAEFRKGTPSPREPRE